VHDDDGWPGGADVLRLPVAVAEHLAGDLVLGRGRDLDELGLSGRKVVGPRKIIAEDGLQMTVAHEPARVKVGGLDGGEFERYRHLELFLGDRAVEEGFGIERAGGFVLVLEVNIDVALLGESEETFGEGVEFGG